MVLFFLAKPLSWIQTALIVSTIHGVVQVLFEIPSGVFADIWGLKTSLIMAVISNFFAVVLYIFSSNFWFLALGSVFTGNDQV